MSAREAKLLQPDLMEADAGAEPVAPSDELRANVLRSALGHGELASFGRRFAELFDLAEPRALELLGLVQRVGEAPWERIALPGDGERVQLLHFAGGPRVASADCGLVSLAPGVRFPLHEHAGDEWSFVLSGAAEEEGTGASWLPGDLVHRPAGSRHAFRVTSREPLVFAVVLEAPIRMVGGATTR
ncbi:MAG TPA: cupin domain-containing protein [Myxococcota bacterium]|nr:cupin domain-containing protein [Myxococcota bacterium]